MNAPRLFPVILHVRIPKILRGCDQQRYIERKLRAFGLRLGPPMLLGDTDIPVGYPLAWNWLGLPDGREVIIEACGEVGAHVTLLELQQHELVEDAMDEAVELERRAKREAERAAVWATWPREAYDDEEEIHAIGPRIGPIADATMTFVSILLKPLDWAHSGVRRIRCWYVREHG